MKLTVERDILIREIQTAQEIIAQRSNLSILSNVLLSAADGTLTIRATDLKVSFETGIAAHVLEPGVTTVFCDKLLGILRTIPAGEIEFDQRDDAAGESFVVRPRFKKIEFKLRSIPADKYPELDVKYTGSAFTIPQDVFVGMVAHTVFAVSDDETRFFMNGVFLEQDGDTLVMVATDGRRLSYVGVQAPLGTAISGGVIVPPKVLNLVRKLASGEGEITIAVADRHIFFAFEERFISSALIDGQFPNYRRVIPEQQEHSVVIDRAELSEALKRVSLLVEKSRRIYVELSENLLQLRSEESEVGVAREEIPVAYTGPETKIALNYTYLVEPLRVIETDEVSLHFTEATKALTLYAEPRDDYFHIIMPMQV